MEMMPYHTEDGLGVRHPAWGEPLPIFGLVTSTDWRVGLPTLVGPRLTLRELRIEDAPSLFEHLTMEEVARFISPPPASVAGFEEFIQWAHRRRAQGRYACFAVVPAGQTAAVGLFQIRVPDAGPQTAEWGFVLGLAYWGTGLFLAAARRFVDFVFVHMGVQRLEARATIPNARSNAALRKVGAVREAVLRDSFERHGERLDQALWTITRDAWWTAQAAGCGTEH
jgi:[ribosomal protein S5]-alanine N-acetyltransferase